MSNSETNTAPSISDYDRGCMEGWCLVKQFNDMIERIKDGESTDFIYGLAQAIEENIDIRKE